MVVVKAGDTLDTSPVQRRVTWKDKQTLRTARTHRETEGKFREVKPCAQEGLSDLEIQPIISLLARPTRAYVSLIDMKYDFVMGTLQWAVSCW